MPARTPDMYFRDMEMNGIETKCVNCGHSNVVTGNAARFLTSVVPVHQVCNNCHEFIDVDVRSKVKINCKHCFAASYFDKDEHGKVCQKCGKEFNAPVEKGRTANFEYIEFSSPLMGAVSRTYL